MRGHAGAAPAFCIQGVGGGDDGDVLDDDSTWRLPACQDTPLERLTGT